MDNWIKDFFSAVDGICDNYDFGYILKMGSLIDTASYCKEFGFSTHNINCVVKSFDYWFIVSVNVCNGHGNIVFDTGIYDDKCIRRSIGEFNN